MKLSKIFWGLMFITTAVVIIMSMFNLLGEGVGWMKLVVSVPIAACVIYSLATLQWSGAFFLSGLLTLIYRSDIERALNAGKYLIGEDGTRVFDENGTAVLVEGAKLVSIDFWLLLAIVTLLSIGFHIIFGKWFTRVKHTRKFRAKVMSQQQLEENVTGDRLYFKEQFSGTSKYINSDNLSYVSIRNRFGGMEVYFDNATLAPEGATVEIDNKFGGVELYIPREWNVSTRVSNAFSGVDCPTKAFDIAAPTLTLTGSCAFGGVDVKRV
jgi:predicted membrane protein